MDDRRTMSSIKGSEGTVEAESDPETRTHAWAAGGVLVWAVTPTLHPRINRDRPVPGFVESDTPRFPGRARRLMIASK